MAVVAPAARPPRATARRILPLALAVLGLTLAPVGTRADDSALVSRVKATYLYKFGDFVEWPPSAFPSSDSPLTLCIAGEDPFGDILDRAVAGQRVGTRPIAVRRLQTVARDSGCQIIYLAASARQPIDEALDTVRGTGVLTVTDAQGGDAQGGNEQGGNEQGVIRFLIEDNHVRFDIDETAAARNGLTISSKLLSLASSFRSGSQHNMR
jgi:hypothetical protein